MGEAEERRGSTARDAAHVLGSFYSLSLDTLTGLFRGPFQWREFTSQFWFVARVSLVPTILMSIPFTVLVVFTLNSLLVEIGASDMSGAGAGLGAVTQIGPLVTVLVVAGAGATAIAADLGSRTIREEIAALEVLGIDPVARLVVPRALASTAVAATLNGAVCAIGLTGGFFFSVLLQNVDPGAYAAGVTLLVGPGEYRVARTAVRPAGPGEVDEDTTFDLDRTTAPYQLTEALGELTTTAADIDTAQVDGLIVDAELILRELDLRQRSLATLFGNVNALSVELTNLVADNETQLAPTLERVDAVLDVLTRNRDNIALAIARLGPYATELGEAVASGPFFNSYIQNLLPLEVIEPALTDALERAGASGGTP